MEWGEGSSMPQRPRTACSLCDYVYATHQERTYRSTCVLLLLLLLLCACCAGVAPAGGGGAGLH
jgi:hypothetical protein